MKATNVTPRVTPARATGSRQIAGAAGVEENPADRKFKVNFEFTEMDVKAIIRGRRELKKADIKRGLGGRSRKDLQAVDAINGLIMLAARVLEDEGRDTSSENFDGRP